MPLGAVKVDLSTVRTRLRGFQVGSLCTSMLSPIGSVMSLTQSFGFLAESLAALRVCWVLGWLEMNGHAGQKSVPSETTTKLIHETTAAQSEVSTKKRRMSVGGIEIRALDPDDEWLDGPPLGTDTAKRDEDEHGGGYFDFPHVFHNIHI